MEGVSSSVADTRLEGIHGLTSSIRRLSLSYVDGYAGTRVVTAVDLCCWIVRYPRTDSVERTRTVTGAGSNSVQATRRAGLSVPT